MEERILSCCFTGYRPQKFPFALDHNNPQYREFENRLISEISGLIGAGCLNFYTGMAMGFDIVAAECVLILAKAFKNSAVRLICAIPFTGQSAKYPLEWKERYENILSAADQKVLISDRYYRNCYFERNRFMVDNSDFVLTWFDGSPGGTRNTIRYAESVFRKVINLYTGCEDDRSYSE
ncbi:MAG: DUF1273 family protein [Clostridia bacterium]|nr:DUF1273 family protein [Clostridia bacterium]